MATRTTSYSTNTSSVLLHRTLQLDALSSFLGAVGFLAVSINPLAQIMGFTEPVLPIVLAIALLVYVGWLLLLTRQPDAEARQSMIVVAINDLWVVGWVAVLIFNLLPLTLLGKLFVGPMVVVVGLFAIVEFYAVRKVRQ